MTMGRYGGAEIYELVRIYILTRLATIIKKCDCGQHDNHISYFKNETQINKATLAKFGLEPKQNDKTALTLKWYIVKSVPSYSNITKS